MVSFVVLLRGYLHPALHPGRHAASKLIDRLLFCRPTYNLKADTVGHSHTVEGRGIEVRGRLADKPLTGRSLLDEEELLLGVIEEEKDVHQLGSCRLRRAGRHRANGLVVSILHHVLDEGVPVIAQTRSNWSQILVDPPRSTHGTVERISVGGPVCYALVEDPVIVRREERADGRDDRTNLGLRRGDRCGGSLKEGKSLLNCDGSAAQDCGCGSGSGHSD